MAGRAAAVGIIAKAGANMGNGTSSPSDDRGTGSPELWVTPVIGLVLLAPLIYHWRLPLAAAVGSVPAGDWRIQLKANIGLDIAIGVVPMFAAACLQRLLRAWRWPGWARGLAGGLIGALFVGVFYDYALYPLSHGFKPYDEGEGNVLAIYAGDIFGLAIVGGFAVFASVMLISILIRRRCKA